MTSFSTSQFNPGDLVVAVDDICELIHDGREIARFKAGELLIVRKVSELFLRVSRRDHSRAYDAEPFLLRKENQVIEQIKTASEELKRKAAEVARLEHTDRVLRSFLATGPRVKVSVIDNQSGNFLLTPEQAGQLLQNGMNMELAAIQDQLAKLLDVRDTEAA